PWSTWAMIAMLRRLRIDFHNEGRALYAMPQLRFAAHNLYTSPFPTSKFPTAMDTKLLAKTAAAMVAKGKGILAADESSGTGEKVSQGLDDLAKRLDEYFKLGCRFAKWRSTITISDTLPTHTCLYANAHVLSRYAAACQVASIVPMVEPEVLLDGTHTAERSEEVHEATLRALYS